MHLLGTTRTLQQKLAHLSIDHLRYEEARAWSTNLREVLREHNHRYYVEDDPIIADVEYDQLYQALLAIEERFPAVVTPDSPTQRVGDAP
ncbi:MAG: NAD-dependent DNA ligase LigA, partial [Rhodothermales bacterium]